MRTAALPLSCTQQQEYESLIATLQEELHAKSASENEQAILFRQEKKILQSRIQHLLQSSSTETTTTTASASAAVMEKEEEEKKADSSNDDSSFERLQQQIAQLSKQLLQKQNEIDKLHNILEEMQQALDLKQNQNNNDNLTKDDSLDTTCHEQIVQRLLSRILHQPTMIQEQIERELSKRHKRHSNNNNSRTRKEKTMTMSHWMTRSRSPVMRIPPY
jgi:chromosome segregation ATPase